MAGLDELDFAQRAAVSELLHVEILAGIDHCFHHHVLQPSLFRQLDDLFAIRNARRHRHGAGDVFAGFERGDGLPGMIGDGRINVDEIHFRIFQQLLEIRVTLLHAKGIADRVQFFARPLANGVHAGVGMALVDGNEFGPETEADNSNVQFPVTHKQARNWLKSLRNPVHFQSNNNGNGRINAFLPAHCQPESSESSGRVRLCDYHCRAESCWRRTARCQERGIHAASRIDHLLTP